MNDRILGWTKQVRSLRLVGLLEHHLAPSWRRQVLALVLLGSVFVAAFLQAQRTPGGSDDCVYFEHAAGHHAGAPHHRQRFALLGTVKLAQAVFGYTSLAYYSVPFVYGLGLVFACYFAARTFVSIALAVMAALMVLALPTVLQQGTWLLADIPSMFWTVLGTALFMRALAASDAKWPLTYTVSSGVCCFLAVLTKESTAPLLLGLGFFPLALRSKRSLHILLGTAAVTIALELVELLVMWAVFGDAWHRLHAVQTEQLPYMERAVRDGFELPEHITWASLLTRFASDAANDSYINGWRFLGLGYWDWLVASLPLGLTVAVLRKHRLLLGLFGFVSWSYLALSLAVTSFDPLIPMVITKSRYFLVVLVWLPILVLAGWSCFWSVPWQRWERGKVMSIIAVLTLYLGVSYATARNYLDGTNATIRNGNTLLADAYGAVVGFTRTGGEVKRVVGPRPLRAAKFVWPEHTFDVHWRPDEIGTKHRLRPLDFVIAQKPMAVITPPGLLWRSLGATPDDRHFYIEPPKAGHPRGSYGMVVATRSHLLRRPKGARLDMGFELDTHRTVPGPLKVLVHREDGKAKVLATFAWKHEGRRASIDQTTDVFRTTDAEVISIEFDVREGGRFFIKRQDFRLLAPPDTRHGTVSSRD